MIVVVFGLPGSGKSYFAARLADRIHAVHISSDRVRRILFSARTYSTNEKLSVYDAMLKQMKQKVKQPGNVVLDATFYKNDIRNKFAKEAKGIDRIFFIEVRAGESLIRERLKRLREDSEADFEVYKKIKIDWEPLTEDHLILQSTNDNIRDMLAKTADYLHLNNDERTN
jgi:predicted kinase